MSEAEILPLKQAREFADHSLMELMDMSQTEINVGSTCSLCSLRTCLPAPDVIQRAELYSLTVKKQ